MITIAREHPVQDDLALLHQRHTEAMHAETPPESIHMLPADALAAPGISFFVMREAGQAIGMGAVKRIDAAMPRSNPCMCWRKPGGGGWRKPCLTT